jgi:hypothetical protein
MECPQVVDGGDSLLIWSVNILNNQQQTPDKGWFSSIGVGYGLTAPHLKKVSL